MAKRKKYMKKAKDAQIKCGQRKREREGKKKRKRRTEEIPSIMRVSALILVRNMS
jgi:hypothetical protein